MEREEFKFDEVFTPETKRPTIYDAFGDPKQRSREERVKTAAVVFQRYWEATESPGAPADQRERADIELGVFMGWIDLTDSEREEAEVVARQMNQQVEGEQ